MEQPECRSKIARWLDLLDGGRADNPDWGLVAAGFIFLGFVVFALATEQERPGGSLPVLAQLLTGALMVL